MAGSWPNTTTISGALQKQPMYESYVRRQEADIEVYRKDENLVFPEGIDFCLLALSNEAQQALETVRPQTLGQPRIPGITPAAAIILLRHVRAHGQRRKLPQQQISR